ncbi:MAG: hypothetical protein DMF89_08110 [Acidobacteria bacterium]|nr:MAG: hypothetical protein DMF90_11030 [Acidobacteriota bacterium]PYR50776.1 MAG: hypothetical protein DMF89_08110 [Acidobacteriota bacterium]
MVRFLVLGAALLTLAMGTPTSSAFVVEQSTPDVFVRRLSTNPLVTVDSSSTRGGNVNGPTVIRVPSWVDRPLGRYFMYFANHMGDSIRLAYGHWRCTGAGARVDDRLDPRLADMARLAAHSGPAARGAV